MVRLCEARVYRFKSFDDSTSVHIDPMVTALVGQNESGKTAFLQALHKAHPADEGVEYDVVTDYPRKDLLEYEERHDEDPDSACSLTYELNEDEIRAINDDLVHRRVSSSQ